MGPSICGVAAVSVLTLLSGAAPATATESGTTTAKTSTEAWYTTTGACDDPAECSTVPAPEPPVYPENTLHVDIKAGQPTAASYLQLDTSAIPFGSKITGGTVTLPVDQNPKDGALTPEQANIVACAVTEPIEEAQGSTSKPPKTDCKAVSTPAQFTKGKDPAFTVDVRAFASQWSETNEARLALLPAPEAESERETWHVTFWGKKNDSDKAAPITAELHYAPSEEDLLPPVDDSIAPDLLEPELAAPPAVPDAGPVEGPPPQPAEALADQPKAEKAPKAEVAPRAMPALREVGYPYPAAWLMPLALLIGFGVTGRALTKNLELPSKNELSLG